MKIGRSVGTLLVAFLALAGVASCFSLFGLENPFEKKLGYSRTRGEPKMPTHPTLLLDCPEDRDGLADDHPCSHKMILQRTSYEGNVITNSPIYGVLTQPYSTTNEDAADSSTSMSNSYILTSHVKLLESGGARIVPVNYRLKPTALKKLLGSLNGIYIPGDSSNILSNDKYMDTVKNILEWAQTQNAQSKEHFPVVAISYGYLALVKSSVKKVASITDVPSNHLSTSLEVNLRLTPEETYIFDSYNLTEAEATLDNSTFYNELKSNIDLKTFLKEKVLSRVFVPIATFNEDKKNQEDEYVAIMEGVAFPFFGIAFSIEKIQYNFDLSIEDQIDHTKYAVHLALQLANLFVDEARLNGNFFSSRKEEAAALIQNYDSKLKEKDTEASGDKSIIELYLFD